jgi:predicted HTH transcriptional regulator
MAATQPRDWLADLTSFANSAGGHLVLGMKERQGVPVGLCGLDPSIDPDKVMLRLNDIARAGVKPRLVYELKAILLAGKGPAVVAHIPRSWNAPHQVTLQNVHRFWGRASNGKYLLDTDELRSLFGESETLGERIADFRTGRIAKILSGNTPAPLADGAKLSLNDPR